jgi:uroporphyrinogen III methyltransferase/synthase
VVRVTAYRKRTPAGTAERARALFATTPWGWVTFTSPSTVRNLVEILGESLWNEGRPTLDAASIGPTTSAELRKFGAEPAVEAGSPSTASLVDSIAAVEASRRRASS